ERAGFVGGEFVHRVAFEGEEPIAVASFEDFRWWLTQAALGKRDLEVIYASGALESQRTVLRFQGMDAQHADAALFRTIGFVSPLTPARVGDMTPQGAAVQSGLASGDLVVQVDLTPIVDGGQLRELIRASAKNGVVAPQNWQVERNGSRVAVTVQPRVETDSGERVGRIGAFIGAPPAMVMVRYGFLDGLQRAFTHTAEVAMLTLRMMGQIVTGDASLKNLSGPITIADYAGKSASMGVSQFAIFLALISVSLGVLNLLPLPVLDGGHLMYYLWESVTGRPPSAVWEERLQKFGLAVLMMMMSVALFNDISRLLG
ncbi:MAG TPA: RIP metalloprotease RseP, partial [Rhodoferax sp.]|nr:RIP metalloprotease RseP [Rhodoferax sp.]